MILVSNHLFSITEVKFTEEHVVRVNLAWVRDVKTASSVLKKIKGYVYLDYPRGRTKPPGLSMPIKKAIDLAKKHKHVKYFSVSNIEEPMDAKKIKAMLPTNIEFVPKIETKRGIRNFPAIMRAGKSTHAMLDKEDLYRDVKEDPDVFDVLVDAVRMYSKEHGVTLLELQGVVFA